MDADFCHPPFQTPCDDNHDGELLDTPDLELELDHILCLSGPGHVEKNLMTAIIQVLWNLV